MKFKLLVSQKNRDEIRGRKNHIKRSFMVCTLNLVLFGRLNQEEWKRERHVAHAGEVINTYKILIWKCPTWGTGE